ncbi:hypothetical protein COB55_04340, partial [Candidatus Wolfebacteria bacterium]
MAKESFKDTQKRLKLESKIGDLLKGQTKDLATLLSFQRKIGDTLKDQKSLENDIIQSLKDHKSGKQTLSDLDKKGIKQSLKLLESSKRYTGELKNQLSFSHLMGATLNSTLKTLNELGNVNIGIELSTMRVAKWILEQDKYTKQLNLSLGVSGEKAKLMSSSIQDAVSQTQLLGIGVQQLTELQSGLAAETGFVRLNTLDQQKAIAQIASGTKLTTQETGRLVGMYSNMGISLEGTNQRVSDVVNLSEKMGVNTSNVMDSILKSFKSAQKFYFKGGVQSLSRMAVFAEKFKLSIESTLGVMEKGRTLEGSVETMSKLRLLGGEFAKVDPFKFLYQSRSDGEALQKTIANMTKGTAFFNKELGQFQVGAAGMDVLRQAAETLGIPLEELKTTAIRVSEIDMMQKSIPG